MRGVITTPCGGWDASWVLAVVSVDPVACAVTRTRRRAKKLDLRFLTLAKQADQILQAAAPAIDRLGPIRLNSRRIMEISGRR